MDNQNNRSNKNNPKNNRQGWGVILVTTLLTAFLVMGLFSLMQGSDPQEISYDKFLKMVDEKKVEKVTIDSAKIYITLTDEARKEAIKKNQEENTATAELLEQIEEKTAGGEREPDYYTGAVKDEVVDIEHLACRLIETLQEIYPHAISQRYQLESVDLSQMESYEILEAIGKKRGMLMSGGVVNTERAAIAVVDEFRSAKLGKITLEQVRESV